MGTIFSITVAALLTYIAYIYNRLVINKNTVIASWSDIDVQLKRRHDLIPKLVDVVKRYANFETETLETITDLRDKSIYINKVKEKSEVEHAIGRGLHRLFILAETYPDLKADQSYLDLHYSLTEIENTIQHARRHYNGAVRKLNTRVEAFPDQYIARFFNFTPAEFFIFDENENQFAID